MSLLSGTDRRRHTRRAARNRLMISDGFPPRNPSRVAVLRGLAGTGDMLCAVPALRALRAALPSAEVVLIGLPEVAWFAGRFPLYVDRFIEFPGWPGLPLQTPRLREIPAFLERARDEGFDLVLQMHGDGRMATIVSVLLGAQGVAGYYTPGTFRPDPERFLLDEWVEADPLHWTRLLRWLGAPDCGAGLEFPLSRDDHAALTLATAERGRPRGPYVCIHPGAESPDHRWSPEGFAEVADAMSALGYEVVLTGTADETDLTRRVAQAMRAHPLDLAGAMGIGAMGALLSNARLLITNDTGASQLAAALRTPSVVLFTAGDPLRWAPLDRSRHRVIHAHRSPAPCLAAGAPDGFRCVEDVTPATVVGQARLLLESAHDARPGTQR